MTYKVVQWATGSVGRYALRQILERDDLELVGLMVHSDNKAGMDAGELVGLPPVGVRATTDPGAIAATDADIVCYMPLPSAQMGEDPSLDERVICELLASGLNVVTAVGFLYPKAYGPDLVRRIEEACAKGGTTLHGTGVNPGFLNEVLPLTLSALSQRIDQIYVADASEFSTYPSTSLVVDMMGFSKPPADYDREATRWRSFMGGLFRESLLMVADGLAVELDEIVEEHETALAGETFDVAACTIPAGTVCGQRWRWTGMVGGAPFIVLEAVYKARPGEPATWPDASAVRIEGRPRIALDLGAAWCDSGVRATAGHAVNAIPAVCEAPPGIATLLDLPMVTGRLASRGRASSQ